MAAARFFRAFQRLNVTSVTTLQSHVTAATLHSHVTAVMGTATYLMPRYEACRHMAGHSKWQNIRHTKGAKDAQKATTNSFMVKKIRVAVKEGGGSTNPKLNSLLARTLEEAKLKGVPNSTVDATIKKIEKHKAIGAQMFFEGKAFNANFVVEVNTDKRMRAYQSVQNIFKRFAGTLGDKHFAAFVYDYKGVLRVRVSEENPLSLDSAEEIAIEADAEEVEEDEDEDNNKLIKFLCDPDDIHTVRKNLVASGLEVAEAGPEYIPHTFVTVEESFHVQLSRFFDLLEELDDVVRVYDNIKVPDS